MLIDLAFDPWLRSLGINDIFGDIILRASSRHYRPFWQFMTSKMELNA